MDDETVDRFSQEARTFCAWALGDSGNDMDVRSALLRILALYHAALLVPNPWSERLSSDSADVDALKEDVEVVLRRASDLPCQFYSEVFDPFESAAEPVTGHLTDDIGDIYRDVVRGLILFDRGQRDEALWKWGFNLKVHWGEHATSAIRAMHAYLAQENPDGLTSSA